MSRKIIWIVIVLVAALGLYYATSTAPKKLSETPDSSTNNNESLSKEERAKRPGRFRTMDRPRPEEQPAPVDIPDDPK